MRLIATCAAALAAISLGHAAELRLSQLPSYPSDPDFRQPEMDDLLSEVSVSTWAARDDSRHYRIRAYSAFAC